MKQGVVPSTGKNLFSSSKCPDRQQCPPSPPVWTMQPYVKLTTHFHPVGGYSSSKYDGWLPWRTM